MKSLQLAILEVIRTIPDVTEDRIEKVGKPLNFIVAASFSSLAGKEMCFSCSKASPQFRSLRCSTASF